MQQRARLDEALEALKAVARRRAGALQAAATANDSVDESACAETLTTEIDACLTALGWTRTGLVEALAASQEARALCDRASAF